MTNWKIRRADDFPEPRGSGNRAFCCSCTCCIFIITGIAGAVVGGIVGGFAARKSVKSIRASAPRLNCIALASMGGAMACGAALVAMMIAGGLDSNSPLVPLLPVAAAAFSGGLASMNDSAAKLFGALGAGFFWVSIGIAAGGFIGLMIGMLAMTGGIR